MRCVSVPSVKRNQPKGARFAPFGLGLALFTLIPNEIGYQDIASLLARQPGVTERWQKRVIASSAASIQVATFAFGRDIGAAPRAAHLLASLGGQSGDSDVTGSIPRNPLMQPALRYQAQDFPVVVRTLKGDRLAIAPTEVTPGDAAPSSDDQPVAAGKIARDAAPLDADLAAALNAPPLTAPSAETLEGGPLNESKLPLNGVPLGSAPMPSADSFSIGTSNLFFGSNAMGETGVLQRWEPGEEPTVVADPELKMAVLPSGADHAGLSIAGKGHVNLDNQHATTPAERLGLFDPKARAKQEKCLTEAVYFEARGEAVRGQIAVAQVVMNRAFSGYYPTTPCGVVYQNSHRRLACQFTFACDGIRDVVKEPDMWDRARRIAKETLDGRLWLPEVGKSTHYHAYWVHPSWVREMKKQYRFGVHTFYRPRNWGDGADKPSWGDQEQTAEISASLAAVKP
jgi:hypothetical protein